MYRMQHRTYSGIVLSWHARSWPSLYLNTEFLLCMVRSAWSDQPPPLHSSQSSSKDTSLHSLLMAYNQRYNVPSGASDSSLRQWNIRRRYINSWLIDWSIDWLIESVVHISRQKNWKFMQIVGLRPTWEIEIDLLRYFSWRWTWPRACWPY